MEGPHRRHQLVRSDPADPTLEEIICCSSAPSNNDMTLLGLHHNHHQHQSSDIPRYSSSHHNLHSEYMDTTATPTTIPRPHSMSSLHSPTQDYHDFRRTSDPTSWSSITPPTFDPTPLFDTWEDPTAKPGDWSRSSNTHDTCLDDYHTLLFLRHPYTPPDSPSAFHFSPPTPEICITPPAPLPPQQQRRTSKPPSSSRRKKSNSNITEGISFVNFTPSDASRILSGVAPSGSSKTKARREREAMEKRRKLSEAAAAAVRAAGGDTRVLAEVDLI